MDIIEHAENKRLEKTNQCKKYIQKERANPRLERETQGNRKRERESSQRGKHAALQVPILSSEC